MDKEPSVYRRNLNILIIRIVKQGKPYVFPMGRQIVRDVQYTEGRGYWKKRRLMCNA